MHLSVIALLFIVTVTASGGAGFMYKKITSLHEAGNDIPTVLLFAPLPLIVLFAVLASVQGWNLSWRNVLPGIAGGASFTLAVAMLLMSVQKGNYSVSVIIINLSFFIPILFSALFLGDTVQPLQMAGILVLTLVIVFANVSRKRRPPDQAAPTVAPAADCTATPGVASTATATGNAWIVYALLACLFNGAVNVALKVQNHYIDGGENSFYFVLYATAFVLGLAACLLVPGARTPRPHPFWIPVAAMCLGVCVAFNYYPLSLIAPYVNAAVLFGVATSGAIVTSLLAGWIFFREKITVKSAVSLVCCALVIVLQVVSV